MIIPWIILFILICYIVFSYIKHFSFKIRVLPIVILLIISLVLVLPVFGFSIMTLLGLFLLEKLWILLAMILFIEVAINKNNKTFLIISGVISMIIYLYLRTMI